MARATDPEYANIEVDTLIWGRDIARRSCGVSEGVYSKGEGDHNEGRGSLVSCGRYRGRCVGNQGFYRVKGIQRTRYESSTLCHARTIAIVWVRQGNMKCCQGCLQVVSCFIRMAGLDVLANCMPEG